MKFLSSMITMTTTVNFIITTTFLATTTTYSTTISAAATTTTVSNDQLPLLLSSSSSFNNLRHYHRGRFLDDEEENGNIDNNDNGGPDGDSIVMGSCLFVTDHPNDTTPYNNNNLLSSCTEFYGEADGDGNVWDYDKMVNYCSHKYNSTLTIKEECPSNYSLSSELEIVIGWCHVEEVIEGNITLIQVTPMVTITSPTSSNCSDNQRECESVMGGIFKTTSECTTTATTTSISISNNSAAIIIDDNDEEGDSPEQEVIAGYDDGCDESKCVSRGLEWLFNYSFTCYTNDFYSPMMCADGYQPQIVEYEPTVYYDHYFTCCPPNPSFNATTSVRHCSNTTTFSSLNNKMICEDDNRPYPRRMKNYTMPWADDELVESYICCDSIINNNDKQTTNFLNELECVPYKNKNYKHTTDMANEYGSIIPLTTYCKDSETGFQYVSENWECCRTKRITTTYKQDIPFKKTVYPMIALSTIAVISCTILIVALSTPLWLHWRIQSAAANVPVSTTRAANRRLQQAAAASTYSSYNLYLVFLAIPDFLLNLYLLVMYGSYANQKYNPSFSGIIIRTYDGDDGFYTNDNNNAETSFILACSTANLYLNCVVSYEMFVLLRNNNQLITHNPPSLLRVTLQAMGVYLFSIIVFIIHYFIGRSDIDDPEFVNLIWSILVAYVFPIVFVLYIWITITCRGYMPSVTESTKQLVSFFFRIVFVFWLIWLPGMGLIITGIYQAHFFNDESFFQIGLLFCGIQPTVSTYIAMTKADVRQYTLKVVGLSYISSALSSSASYIRTSLSSNAE